MRKVLLALALALAPTLVLAQSARDFPTPNLGERVPGVVTMCLNASGQAVAQSSGTCVGGSTVTLNVASNLATGQVTAGTTVTLLVAARTGRQAVTIINEGTTAVRIGPSGVTTGTGALLPGSVGAAITLNTSAAVYGIVASGTQIVSYTETY